MQNTDFRFIILVLFSALFFFFVTSVNASITEDVKFHFPNASAECGTAVAISGNKAVVGAPRDLSPFNSTQDYGVGVVYFLTGSCSIIPCSNWDTIQRLTPDDCDSGDNFGASVAIDGDYAVVGAPYHQFGIGAVYLLNYTGSSWVIIDKILGPGFNSKFGQSVSIYGNNILIGAPDEEDSGVLSGLTYLYRISGNSAVQSKIFDSPISSDDHQFGRSVSINDDFVIIGSKGRATLYQYTGLIPRWTNIEKFTPSVPSDDFGSHVTITDGSDLNTVHAAVSNPATGDVFVYGYDGKKWKATQIVPSTGTGGGFGASIFLSGSYLIVGAPENSNKGAAFLFYRTAKFTWEQKYQLTASDGESGDRYGTSVSLSGSRPIVGAVFDEEYGIDTGSAYIHDIVFGIPPFPNRWTQVKKLIPWSSDNNDFMGASVSTYRDWAVVGVPYYDHSGVSDAGIVIVYKRTNNTWEFFTFLEAPTPLEDAHFGSDVSIDVGRILIGAPGEYDNEGAVYLFSFENLYYWIFKERADLWVYYPNLAYEDTFFGSSVDIDYRASGYHAIVGAPGSYGTPGTGRTGRAFIMTSGNSINITHDLLPSDSSAEDKFGCSVAMDGETVLVGSSQNDYSSEVNPGAAYTFMKVGDNWVEQAKLIPNDPSTGGYFGTSVALEGKQALLGSYEKGAYVFRNCGDSWTQVQKLAPSSWISGFKFGSDVAMDGKTAIVSASVGMVNDKPAGTAFIFEYDEKIDTWIETYLLHASDASDYDYFGWAIDVSGDSAIVGSFMADFEDGPENVGAAYLFNFLPQNFPWQGGAFDFDLDTTQGWWVDGTYNENDDGPDSTVTLYSLRSDTTAYPVTPETDALCNGAGAFQAKTNGTPYIETGKFKIIKLRSPDLTASGTWQQAAGFTVKMADRYTESGPNVPETFAQLYVTLHDLDQGIDRLYCEGCGDDPGQSEHFWKLDPTVDWHDLEFYWGTADDLPANYQVKNIYVALWLGSRENFALNSFFMDNVTPVMPCSDSPIITDITFEDQTPETQSTDIAVTTNNPCGGRVDYTYQPLNGGYISGSDDTVTFSSYSVEDHNCPYRIQVTATSNRGGQSTSLIIEITVTLAGDMDKDGDVDGSDIPSYVNFQGDSPPLSRLAQRFGKTDGCGTVTAQ